MTIFLVVVLVAAAAAAPAPAAVVVVIVVVVVETCFNNYILEYLVWDVVYSSVTFLQAMPLTLYSWRSHATEIFAVVIKIYGNIILTRSTN